MEPTLVNDVDLRRLADMEGPERAFVSLYLASPDARAGLSQRAGRIDQVLPDEGPEREHFEQSLALIEKWLDDHSPKGPACVFASWALDWVEGYELALPVPDRIDLGDAPYIRPLAHLQDEYETFAVVAADNDATRIFLVTSGEAELAERIKGGVKNHVKKGGWSQKRYQRRRGNELMHYAKEVGETLGQLAREVDFGRVVFLGSHEAMNEIIRELPTEVADKTLRQKDVDLEQTLDDLIADAFQLYFEEERSDERDLWSRIQEEYLSDGLAAVGPTDVLQAATVGRVEEMIVTRDARIRGVKCMECENVVHGTPDTCSVCGSASVFELDLVEELVRLAEQTSAHVDFVDPMRGLQKAKDVAAILRY